MVMLELQLEQCIQGRTGGKGRRIPGSRNCTGKECAGTWDAQGTEASLGRLKHEDFGNGGAELSKKQNVGSEEGPEYQA